MCPSSVAVQHSDTVMDYDPHISEVTIYNPYPPHPRLTSSSCAFARILQWRHRNAHWLMVSSVLTMSPAGETIILREMYIHGRTPLTDTTVKGIVLIDCLITRQALLGILVPECDLAILGDKTTLAVGPDTVIDGVHLSCLELELWRLLPGDGNQLYTWLAASMTGVDELLFSAELDVDITIVQGALDRWCRATHRIKIQQIHEQLHYRCKGVLPKS